MHSDIEHDSPTAKTPPLPNGEVHVWRISLDEPSLSIRDLGAFLADDERQRALGFRVQKDRERFIARRGLLRRVLSGYARIGPEHLRFAQGRHGKPALTGVEGGISFNVSHSGSRALFAVARGGLIGVDVELVRADIDCERFAARFFSKHEQAELMALPPSFRRRAFFQGWVRKEACLKAQGDGLMLPLERFSVSLSPHQPERFVEITSDSQGLSRWSLQEIDAGRDESGGDHVAALAVESASFRLRMF